MGETTDPWDGFTGQSQADADDALITDPLVRQISELRAALGYSEARRAELEAVIEKARETAHPIENGEPLRNRVIEALDSAPSVVLEDRDRENRATGWDEGHAHCFHVDPPSATRNPYRGDNQ
jgi:hypothetical protein